MHLLIILNYVLCSLTSKKAQNVIYPPAGGHEGVTSELYEPRWWELVSFCLSPNLEPQLF